MLVLKDIWIGEKVLIVSSGRRGVFRGIHENGKGRIESDGKMYLATGKNLKIYDPKDPEPILSFNLGSENKLSFHEFNSTIDLHIEKLKPDLITAIPERIIDFQIKAFEKHLENASELGIREITIIHGKGTGALKSSILTLIKNDKRVKLHTEINQGGALQLLL